MPKVARTADAAVDEAPVSKQARLTSASPPLAPHLSIHLSPPQLEQSTEADSTYSDFPLLTPPENKHTSAASPGTLSPHLTICLNSKADSSSAGVGDPLPDCEEDNALSVSQQTTSEKATSLSEEQEDLEDFASTQQQDRSNGCPKDVWKENGPPKAGDCRNGSGDKRKDKKMAAGDNPASMGESNCLDVRPEGGSKTSEKGTGGSTLCSLPEFVPLAARNGGDSLLQGVLPPVFAPHQAAPLTTCFPATDGNWYQILSASLPPPSLSASLPAAEKESKAQTGSLTGAGASKDTTSSAAASSYHPLGLLSGLSLTTSAASLSTATTTSASIVGPLSSPAPSPDPLLSLLQQYTTGTACGSSDLQTSLSALHMPFNVASAAVAAAAASGAASSSSSPLHPRYLYATNPRTGQLLILSSVGELAGTQPLHLQSVLQLQQQHQMKMQEKSWKSPLCLKQCQNNNITTTTTISNSSLTAGKPAPNRPVSLVSLGTSRMHDENMPSVAAARDLLALATSAHSLGVGVGVAGPAGVAGVPSFLFNTSPEVKPTEEPVRENHNMKERRRRARIKNACDLMRQLVPGMSEKTDKATVFEFSARYIHFLKNFVGTHHDKDFLVKYSPY